MPSWTWDVTHERALSPADLFRGKALVGVGAFIGLLERILQRICKVHSSCASVTAVYLPFFVFGRVLTRLD